MNKYTLTKAFTLDRDFFNIPRETGTNISLGYVWFNGNPSPTCSFHERDWGRDHGQIGAQKSSSCLEGF